MRKGTRILLAMLLTVLALFAMTAVVSAATDGANEREAGHYFYFEDNGVTKYYVSLTEATNAVPEGGTIYLLDDVVLSSANLNTTKNYTIDGVSAARDDNGNYGHREDGRYCIYVTSRLYYGSAATTADSGFAVTLQNLEIIRTGGNYCVDIYCQNTLNFKNTYVQGDNYIVHLRYTCEVNFLGDKNVVVATENGGAIRNSGTAADAVCNIEGGKFYGGTGGVFYIAADTNLNVSVKGGSFFHTGTNLIDNDAAACTMKFEAGSIYLLGGTAPDATVFAAADVYEFLTDTLTIPANDVLVINAMTDTAKYLPEGTTTSVENPGYRSFNVGGYYGNVTLGAGASLTINEGHYKGQLVLSGGNVLRVNGAIFSGSTETFKINGGSNTVTFGFGYYTSNQYIATVGSGSTGNTVTFDGGFYLSSRDAAKGRWLYYETGSGSTVTVNGGVYHNATTTGAYGMFCLNNSSLEVHGGIFDQVSTYANNSNAIFYMKNNNAKTLVIHGGTYTAGYRVINLYGGNTSTTVKGGSFTASQQVFTLMGASSKLTVENGTYASTTNMLYISGAGSEAALQDGSFYAAGNLYLPDANCTLRLQGGTHTSDAYGIYTAANTTRTIEISGGAVLKGTQGIYFTTGTTTLTVTGEGTQVVGTKYNAVQAGNGSNTNKYTITVANGAKLSALNANGASNNCYAIKCMGTTTDSTVTLNGGTLQGYTYGAIGLANAKTAVDIIINSGTVSTAGRWLVNNNLSGVTASTVTLNGGLLINTNAAGLSDDDGTYPMFKDITPVFNRVVVISNAANGAAVSLVADSHVLDSDSPVVMRGDVKYYVWIMQESTDASLAPTMENGAQIRADVVEEQSGIRFVTTLSAEVQEKLLALKNAGATLAFGTLIAPADYVAAAGEFTRAALDALNLYTAAYVDIPAVHSVEDNDGNGIPDLFHGILVGIKVKNAQRHFAVCSYVKVTDGSGTNVYYSAYSTEANSRTMHALSVAALQDVKAEQTVDYLFPSILELGAYSRYSEKAQTVLNVYAGLIGNVLSQTLVLNATSGQLLPELADELIWESADSSIARVENGYVTGVYPGQTVITATTAAGSVALSCTVTVERPATGVATFTVSNQQELERALSAANAKDTIALCGNVVITQTIGIEKALTFTGTATDRLTGDGITKLFDIKAACNLTLAGEAIYDYTASTVTDSKVPMVGVSVASGTVRVYVNGGDIRALHGCFLQQNGSAANLYAIFNGGVVRAPYAVRVQSGTGRVTLSGGSLIVTGSASPVATAAISLESTAATNTLVFTKGSITACREGELGYNAEDTTPDRGVYVGTDTKLTATFGAEASIVTKGVAIYTENLAAATVNINGGQYESEDSYVVFFDAKPCATGGTPATLNVKGGSFIGNDEAETTLYVTCSNQKDESVGTLCNIYDGYFYNDKWSAVRASHGGVLKLYGGYYCVTSGGGAPVVAGTGSSNYGVVDVYGGSFVHGKQTVGSLFLNASDITRLTLHGMYNGKGGASILASNAATNTLGTQPIAYPEGVTSVQNSICHQGDPVIRLNETAPGITFTGVISEATIAAITAAGGKNLTYGTIFTLAEPLAKRRCTFTKAELARHGIPFVEVTASDGIVARDPSVGGGYSIKTSLTGIDKENYMRQYAVAYYVQYTVNGNTVTQYSCYDAATDASSAAAAAADMLAGGTSLTATELAIVKQFVVPVTVNGVSLDRYTVLVDDTTVRWSEIVGYVNAELKAIVGTGLTVKPYTAALQSANRSIVLAYSSSLGTMQYQISLSGDDITIKVGSLAAAYTLAIVFMEETLRPNDSATLAVALTAKTALAGKDYKVSLAAGSTMRAMTFNTLGGGDYNSNGKRSNVIASVAAYAPDFAGMQEHYNDTTMDAAMAELGYAKAGATILSLCPDADANDKEWGRLGSGACTEIYYNAERFTLVEEDAFLYHWEYRCVHSGTKSISYGVFLENATGKHVMVINLHGAIVLSDYSEHGERSGYEGVCTPTVSNNVEGNKWRIENAKTVLALFDALRAKYAGAITLIMGDMNDSEEGTSLRLLEKHAALTNVLRLLDDDHKDAGPGSHSLSLAPTVGKPIDHIYITEDVATVQNHFIIKHQLTLDSADHCPVVADFAAK